jgi:hypothetical protein
VLRHIHVGKRSNPRSASSAVPSSPIPRNDGQAYGFAAAFGAGQSCEQQAVD